MGLVGVVLIGLVVTVVVLALTRGGRTPGTPSAASATSPTGPACDAAVLFAAAVAKEGFNPDDPSYASLGAGQGPGAFHATCLGGWAMATVSRPPVGTTDGDTLFRARGGRWVEVAAIGYPLTPCALAHQGVPPDVARRLAVATGATGAC